MGHLNDCPGRGDVRVWWGGMALAVDARPARYLSTTLKPLLPSNTARQPSIGRRLSEQTYECRTLPRVVLNHREVNRSSISARDIRIRSGVLPLGPWTPTSRAINASIIAEI